MVKLTIKKLKENGDVTDKEIQKWKANRQKETKKERNKDKKRYNKQIIALLKKGYLEREIAEKLGKSLSTISNRVSLLKSEGKITEEEIKEARKIRRNLEEQIEGKIEEQEEINYKKYKEQMRKIMNLEIKTSSQEIVHFIREFIEASKKKQEKGRLTQEELKELDDLIFMAKININEVIEVVRLHQKLHDYRGGLYFLNSINSLLEGEDKEKVQQIIEIMRKGEKKTIALQMLREGNHTLDEIHSLTRPKHS